MGTAVGGAVPGLVSGDPAGPLVGLAMGLAGLVLVFLTGHSKRPAAMLAAAAGAALGSLAGHWL